MQQLNEIAKTGGFREYDPRSLGCLHLRMIKRSPNQVLTHAARAAAKRRARRALVRASLNEFRALSDLGWFDET